MHHGQCLNLLFPAIENAGGITGQFLFFEFSHELRNELRQGEGESAFTDCYVAIVPGPFIDRTKPVLVYAAYIISGEAMLLVIYSGQPIRSPVELSGLNFLNLPLLLDVEEIFEDQALRSFSY